MFAREGYSLIAGSLVVGVLLIILGIPLLPVPSFILYTLGVAIFVFTLYFFRDPDRTVPADTAAVVLAPADGKVVIIEEVEEPVYIQDRVRKVSIFLSPLNVHVNRVPADGVVEHERYIPGEYLVAWHPKASEKNERSEIGILHPGGHRILFKQIAGAVARRIVYHLQIGDKVRAGDRFGLVKFGSRMDVLIPLDTKILVEVDQKVRAGETILGRLAPIVPDHQALDEGAL